MFFRNKTVETLPIPPIDETVPQNLETATFALG